MPFACGALARVCADPAGRGPAPGPAAATARPAIWPPVLLGAVRGDGEGVV